MKYRLRDTLTESGVRWLGLIPRNWSTVDSRRLFNERKERKRPDDQQLTASQKYGVIPQKEFMRLEDQSVMQVFTGSEILKHVEPGDFVVSMRSFQGGLEWCGHTGCVSSAYVGLTPVKWVVPRFFKHLFKSKPYIQALQSTSNLVRDGQALRYQNFAQVPLPVVAEEEQTQIARFLDYETERIDALIEQQQQLVTLLKEKRQAVISHAVTKGLNPNAPLRDSGVEWLGQVPAHWTVSQLKRTWRSSDYGISESSNTEGIYEVLTMGDIQDGEIYRPGVRFVSVVDKHLLLSPGDLLFNRTNSRALVGKVGLFRSGTGVTFASYCVRLRVAANHDPEFFNYLLNSDYVLASARATSFPSISQTNLNPTRYGELPVAYPSTEEQRAISTHVSESLARLRMVAQRAQEAVELLQERRTVLISAAVTGKIDVRGWAPPKSAVGQDVA